MVELRSDEASHSDPVRPATATSAEGPSRPSWAFPAMSGLPPIATEERTSRIGSFVRPDQRLRSVVSHLSLAARARGVLHWKAEFYPWAPRLSHRNLRREGNDYLCSATCHMGLFPIRKQHGRGRAPNVGASLVHWKLCEAGLRESRAERGQRPH
jgi:hypothetical protein